MNYTDNYVNNSHLFQTNQNILQLHTKPGVNIYKEYSQILPNSGSSKKWKGHSDFAFMKKIQTQCTFQLTQNDKLVNHSLSPLDALVANPCF